MIAVGYITWTDLGSMALIVLGVIICVYLIILIRNINSGVGTLKRIISENEDNINQTLKDVPVFTKNLVEISDIAKNEVKTVEAAINSINETIGSAAAVAGTFKSDIVGRIKMVMDFIDIARAIIPKGKRKAKKKST